MKITKSAAFSLLASMMQMYQEQAGQNSCPFRRCSTTPTLFSTDKALNYAPPYHFPRGHHIINATKHHIDSSTASAMTGTVRTSTWISFPPCFLTQWTLESLQSVKIPLVSQHGCLSWQLADEFNLFLLFPSLKCLPNFKTKAN